MHQHPQSNDDKNFKLPYKQYLFINRLQIIIHLWKIYK